MHAHVVHAARARMYAGARWIDGAISIYMYIHDGDIARDINIHVHVHAVFPVSGARHDAHAYSL